MEDDFVLFSKYFYYRPESGELIWRLRDPKLKGNRVNNTKFAGREVGTITNHPYRKITLFGRQEYAHRIAWLLYHGEWPIGQIDHINGKTLDNRIENLRVVTNQVNGKNQKLRDSNYTGYSGVYWDKSRQKWQAQINIEGKTVSLGRFESLEDAGAARKKAEKEYGYHQNHGRVA